MQQPGFPFLPGVPRQQTSSHADGTVTTSEHSPWIFAPTHPCWDDLPAVSGPPLLKIHVQSDSDLALAAAALKRDGAVVLHPEAAERLKVAAVMTQLSPEANAKAVLANESCWDLLATPKVMHMCEGVLGRQALSCDKAGFKGLVAPPSLFTDGAAIERLPWELQDVQCGAAAEGELRSTSQDRAAHELHLESCITDVLEVVYALESSKEMVRLALRSSQPDRARVDHVWSANAGEALLMLGDTKFSFRQRHFNTI